MLFSLSSLRKPKLAALFDKNQSTVLVYDNFGFAICLVPTLASCVGTRSTQNEAYESCTGPAFHAGKPICALVAYASGYHNRGHRFHGIRTAESQCPRRYEIWCSCPLLQVLMPAQLIAACEGSIVLTSMTTSFTTESLRNAVNLFRGSCFARRRATTLGPEAALLVRSLFTNRIHIQSMHNSTETWFR